MIVFVETGILQGIPSTSLSQGEEKTHNWVFGEEVWLIDLIY